MKTRKMGKETVNDRSASGNSTISSEWYKGEQKLQQSKVILEGAALLPSPWTKEESDTQVIPVVSKETGY